MSRRWSRPFRAAPALQHCIRGSRLIFNFCCLRFGISVEKNKELVNEGRLVLFDKF